MVRLSQQNKILIICTSLNIAGGMERMIVALANEINKSRWLVSLLILSADTTSFYPINKNIPIQNIDVDFGINTSSNYINGKIDFIKDILLLKNQINNINPDFVITTEYPQTAAVVMANLHKKFKIISWQHTTYYQSKSKLWKRLSDWAYTKVAAIICLNKDEQTIYKKFNENAFIIPNFINLPTEQSNLLTHKIVTIARLVENKGIDLLEQAAKKVFEIHKNWQWIVIGTGPLQHQLEQFIYNNYLQKYLILKAPYTSNLYNEYTSAAIYALTSRVEPFGMVLLEAMSYGLPCVAFDCETGPRHIITNNVDGFLIEKENPEKLAEAISVLIEDKEKRSQMGKAAFENVKRFSSDNILRMWEELFKKLLTS